MTDRRPLSSLTSGDFDHPPASTLRRDVQTRLNRLQRVLERTREESNHQAEAARHERWGAYSGQRRRRGFMRPAGPYSPTYEGRTWPRSDDSDVDGEEQRYAKRRKLDLLSHTVDQKAHQYGHYGQVEPGRLKMELCSCDGGVHEDIGRSVYYGPSNILRHDQSVYSSRSPSCNIIIRHHDNTAFCLEKLYILAPERGFTSPVRHGTICVGMGLDELMPFAAESLLYQPDEGRQSSSEEDGDEALTLLESLRDPEISRAMRHGDNQAPSLFPYPLPPAQSNGNRDGRIWANSEHLWPPLNPDRMRNVAESAFGYDGGLDTMPRSTARSEIRTTTLDSGMQVTFDSPEELKWPEEPTTAAVLDDRRRREEITHDLDSDGDGSWAYQDRRYGSHYPRMRPSQLPRYPQLDNVRSNSLHPGFQSGAGSRTVSGPSHQPTSARAGNSRSANDVTRVKFCMEDRRSIVAVAFDPPVSGTCILLQLHGGPGSDNVDIQTVIACGYAGPRFLPAVTLA